MEASRQSRWARAFAQTSRFRKSIYIFWLSLLTVIFFAFTFGVNRLYAKRQHELSIYWFQQAKEALAQGKSNDAVSDLRTALLYSHDDRRYLFVLAQALEAADRNDEARSYLLGLLEDEPGNGDVNLELARIAAKQNDVNHALRYFNGAIYGAWTNDPTTQRQRVRQELITFLIAKNISTQARGELLTFTTEMPKTPASELWVAQAFGRLGDDRSALDFYRVVLRANRGDLAALVGAGDSAFRLGLSREALDDYRRALSLHDDPAVAAKVQLTTLVLDLNPFDTRISPAERRRRVLLALDIVDRRLQQCAQLQHVDLDTPGNNPLQVTYSKWQELNAEISNAKRGSEVVEKLSDVAALVLSIEHQAGCGPPGDGDQAALRVYQAEEFR